MLGRGRPFAVELINCKQIVKDSDKYYQIQQHINNNSNKQVALIDLQFISKIDMSKLKEGEEKKRKQYRCVVWVSKSITEKDLDLLRGMKPIIINQTTPVRVLHRRALMVRKKTIFKIDGKIINEHYLIVDLETQAGTYIKEFIHGDLGRTTPNFGVLLGCEADILLLDVTHIELDFPPKITTSDEVNNLSQDVPSIQSEANIK